MIVKVIRMYHISIIASVCRHVKHFLVGKAYCVIISSSVSPRSPRAIHARGRGSSVQIHAHIVSAAGPAKTRPGGHSRALHARPTIEICPPVMACNEVFGRGRGRRSARPRTASSLCYRLYGEREEPCLRRRNTDSNKPSPLQILFMYC